MTDSKHSREQDQSTPPDALIVGFAVFITVALVLVAVLVSHGIATHPYGNPFAHSAFIGWVKTW